MTTKAELHRRIDALPDDALPAAERFPAEPAQAAAAPYTPLDAAPPDDEAPTSEEEAGVEEAREEYRHDNWRQLADVRADRARQHGWSGIKLQRRHGHRTGDLGHQFQGFVLGRVDRQTGCA